MTPERVNNAAYGSTARGLSGLLQHAEQDVADGNADGDREQCAGEHHRQGLALAIAEQTRTWSRQSS